ncbi:peptide deformylase [Conexibacter sp. JD483]|uniref:peptide deformylase n=1 Tax=unclassified Conexibacter TaxID=2627773 RepID=UPI002717F07F|nr:MULTISPECIES: peptide deformylase [unclassified Conexibacter]MDO8186496.1 peptide deformylase [Conexibacter sp. CPCC 205706]MDO8200065.1 peptide deformylase [Conexibacter sp. CPCC 205762]MDR9372291.1 peptide deformylase [Conexibacter sp. JD483]
MTLPPELHAFRRTVLRQPAAPVAGSGIGERALQRLIDAQHEAMRAAGAAFLTAPQVGVCLRVAVVAAPDAPEPVVLVDPAAGDARELTADGPLAGRVQQALDQLAGVARAAGD